jgi:hypothetical protein
MLFLRSPLKGVVARSIYLVSLESAIYPAKRHKSHVLPKLAIKKRLNKLLN